MFTLKRYVLEIAKTGSFSLAAERLFISQPSLSASIQRLEAKIGEPLFDRSIHPMRLTECGEEYVRVAHAIDTLENDFRAYLEEQKTSHSGRLTIGGSNSNMSFVLPPLLTKYRDLYPQVEVSLVEDNIDELQRLLSEGEIDLMVDSCVIDSSRFEEHPYEAESLILVVPKYFSCNESMRPYRLTYNDVIADAHMLKETLAPPLTLLGDAPFVMMTPETDTGKRERALFRKEGFRPNNLFAIRQQSTAFHLAIRGVGCTIIADTLVKRAAFHPDLVYYKLDDSASSRYIKFYNKKGRRLTFAMRSFLETAGIAVESN